MPLLSIRLPKEHRVWDLPAGRRSAQVREAIDLSLELVGILEDIRERLAAVESRLARLEDTGERGNGSDEARSMVASTRATDATAVKSFLNKLK